MNWLIGWRYAAEGILPADLLQQTESLLRSWQIVLAASSTLERLMASAAAQAQQAIFVRIAELIPRKLCEDGVAVLIAIVGFALVMQQADDYIDLLAPQPLSSIASLRRSRRLAIPRRSPNRRT
jgi:hypothetical protein